MYDVRKNTFYHFKFAFSLVLFLEELHFILWWGEQRIPHSYHTEVTFEKDTLNWRIQDKRGALQKTTLINESGLYTLILKSKLPSAEDFQYWVISEVLPSIRKTGSYYIKEPEYLELGSLEYPMNWAWELSSVSEMYAKTSLKELDSIEITVKLMTKEIQSMRNMLKHIHLRADLIKKASAPIRFNSRLIKYDKQKQLSFD